MRKNNSKEKGLIVCTSSDAGIYPFPIAPLYATAKHALVGAVRSFAMPLEKEGIRINALCPNCIGKTIRVQSRSSTLSAVTEKDTDDMV